MSRDNGARIQIHLPGKHSVPFDWATVTGFRGRVDGNEQQLVFRVWFDMSMAFNLDHICYVFHGACKGCRICVLSVVIVKSVFYVYHSPEGLSSLLTKLRGC